jgi:hypothetical protein
VLECGGFDADYSRWAQGCVCGAGVGVVHRTGTMLAERR